MGDFRFLNPDDFKRWMRRQDQVEVKAKDDFDLVGSTVEPRYCGKRTARNITLESGTAGRVVREFVQNGGVVKAVEGNEYLVEVKSGSFFINKKNVVV